MSRRSTPEDFWRRVDRSGDGCHNWLGCKNNSGYGTLMWHGSPAVAHRVAAFLLGMVPTIAAPLDRKQTGFILHQCDNPSCCNPQHWKIGSYSENQKEAYARHRRRAFKGEAHTNAKLTAQQVADIRHRYPSETQVALAAEFGVTQGCVSAVVRRKTYVG